MPFTHRTGRFFVEEYAREGGLRLMHKLIPIVISLMSIVAPARGQGITPPDDLERALQFIQDVGAPWSVLILIVFVAGRIIKPMSESFIENSRARTESERASRGVLESTAKALNDTGEALKEVAGSMKEIASLMAGQSTKVDDEARTNTAVAAINTNTAKVFDDARKQLVSAAADLERARKSIEDVVTKDHLTNELRPMLAELKTISERLLKTDTAELPAAESPLPERGRVGEVKVEQE